MTSALFTPIRLGGITLPNRIVVSPMCQYSANDGCMSDWHLIHLGSLAISGAGMTVIEATGVTREGRITHGCTGLYSDDNEASMKRVVDEYRRLTKNPIGVQLQHAGRKASTQYPWRGGKALGPQESPWQTLSASALPFAPGYHAPKEMDRDDMQRVTQAFVHAAQRAQRIGLDAIELHASHGYLMHQFLSPLTNARKDNYGGSLENRMRFPLEVARALRDAWPKERCLGARVSGSDWTEGGFEIDETIAFARELKGIGFDYVCLSSGGLVPQARIVAGPGYQVPFAEKVKKAVPIAVRAVGMIADPDQAERIVASGQADMVALARGLLDNPRWVWHAAEKFGVKLDYVPQYARSHPEVWPGSKLARPAPKA
jgi:2,4-dienoyl-CoA reductase-like NADH-dependent reductase (Old Yellow Enzyme family)